MQYDENAEKYGYDGEMTPLKCDKLEQVENPIEWGLYYDQSEVDAAIAELKDVIRELQVDLEGAKTEFAELKAKLENVQASMYADVVDANMENRRLKRALWLTRAMRANIEQYWTNYVMYVHEHPNSFYEFDGDDVFHRYNKNNDSFRIWNHRWQKVKCKCLKKAEEYK